MRPIFPERISKARERSRSHLDARRIADILNVYPSKLTGIVHRLWRLAVLPGKLPTSSPAASKPRTWCKPPQLLLQFPAY